MSDATMLNLPVASSVDGSEYAWIVQGGTDKRVTLAEIANTATGFIPNTRTINTPTTGGLSGGGVLTGDLSLSFNPSGLTAKTAMAVADYFAINDVAGGNVPKKATFPNAMKALTGLTALGIPDLAADYLIINHAADGESYKISPSSLSLAAGNVPAGGLTNQFLAKASNTDYDTVWTDPAVLLDANSLAGNPTGSPALNTSVTLGATLAFSGTALQTGAGTSDVTWSANSFVTTIANNAVTDAKFRQSAALSVVGRSANSTGNVADIAAASDAQILRRSGTSLGFGSIDLAASGAVGSSILLGANGGTGVANTGKTITLGGSLVTSGAFDSTFTITGATSVTFPTSGTLATTAGAAIPSIAQGDLLYGSASNVLSALTKDANATRYLSNTGSSNNPAWAQVALATGVSGQLPLANGGSNANLTASIGGLVYSTASAMAILAGTATAGQIPRSGSSAAPSWSTATYPSTAAAGTILAAASANTIAATATPFLGIAGSVVGTLGFANATSGSITLSPVAGALGSATLTMPAATDTIAVLAASQVLTNKTINGASNTLTVRLANDVTGLLPNSNLANMNAHTFKGNNTGSAAAPSDLTVLNMQAELLSFQLSTASQSINFNSANTDTSFTISLPTGATRYRLIAAYIFGASGTLTTATFGVFTAAAAGGTAVVASGTACTVSTGTDDTNNNLQIPAIVNGASTTFTAGTLFFRVQTPQGVAATGRVLILYSPMF